MSHTHSTTFSNAPLDPRESRWQRLDWIGREITERLRSCRDADEQDRLLRRKSQVILMKKLMMSCH